MNVNKAVSETLIQTQCAAVLVHKCYQATDDSLDIDQNHASTHTHIYQNTTTAINIRVWTLSHYFIFTQCSKSEQRRKNSSIAEHSQNLVINVKNTVCKRQLQAT